MSIPENQALIDALTRKYLTPDPQPNGNEHRQTGRAGESTLTDDEVLKKLFTKVNWEKWRAVFNGGYEDYYPSPSEAVAALLRKLAFYSGNDAAQMERIIRKSALYTPKFDTWRGAETWLSSEIKKAIAATPDPYSPARSSFSSFQSRPGGTSDDENKMDAEIQWFHELGEPKPRKYIIEKIGVKDYPIVAFGAGGVAKSFAMLAAGIAIAGAQPGTERWLGMQVLEHGYVLYLDFELDVEEQHRRVRDLCNGLSITIPKRLAYLSGVGITTDAAFRRACKFTKDYKAVAVIIDSVGLAMMGDMDRGKDVLAFYRRYIDPLRRLRATPLLVDHEGKLQAGEKHKDKSPIGSAYKAWAARSVLQFELDEYDEENAKLDLRVRQTKANFGPKLKPFSVSFTFEEQKVSIETRDLPDEELMDEDRQPVRDRILAALKVESQTVADLERLTGAATGTIYNNLAQLVEAKEVREDGYRGRKKLYALSSSSSPPGVCNESEEKKEQGEHKENPVAQDAEAERRVRQLVYEGMAEHIARAQVYGKRTPEGAA